MWCVLFAWAYDLALYAPFKVCMVQPWEWWVLLITPYVGYLDWYCFISLSVVRIFMFMFCTSKLYYHSGDHCSIKAKVALNWAIESCYFTLKIWPITDLPLLHVKNQIGSSERKMPVTRTCHIAVFLPVCYAWHLFRNASHSRWRHENLSVGIRVNS